MKKLLRVLNTGVGILLLTVVLLACLPLVAFKRPQLIVGSLDSVVAADVSGWQMRRLKIAESDEMRGRVMDILRYDDVIFRSYRRGNTEIQIYAAYWKPGSVPYGQAGVHTPDTCWVVTGWVEEDRRHAQPLNAGLCVTKPAETGRFSKSGQKLEVAFWHLVGGQVNSYDQYGAPTGFAGVREKLPHLLQDFRRFGLDLAQEQIFVRISADVPLESLLQDAAFGRLLETLRPLGVLASDKA